MSRLFDGVDDLMTYDPGFGVDGANDHTFLVVVKNVAGSSWASLIEAEDSGGAIVVAIGRRSNGQLYYAWTSSLNDGGSSTNITATDTWWVLAVSKVGGSSAPRFHKVDTGGANPVHTDGGAASGGGPATRIKLGGDDDPANIRLAVAALFDKALSDAEVESIASDLSTQAIADLAPVALYDDSDAFATNLVNPGTYDRSALVGTADDADDPAGWTYGLGGATDFPLDMAPGSYAVSGVAASLLSERVADAASGGYAVAGVDAAPAVGFVFLADPGAYVIAGIDAEFARGILLSTAPGAYAISGAGSALLSGRVIGSVPGAYILSGIDAELLVVAPGAFALDASAGAYVLAGADVLLVVPAGFSLDATPGVYVVTGADAGLLAAYLLGLDPGAVVLAGDAARLPAGRVTQTAPGAFTLAGADVAPEADRLILAATGAHAVDGLPASFTAGLFAQAAVTTRTRSRPESGTTERRGILGRTLSSVGSGAGRTKSQIGEP